MGRLIVERDRQINRIVGEVWDLSDTTLAEALRERCGEDADLRREVELRLEERPFVSTRLGEKSLVDAESLSREYGYSLDTRHIDQARYEIVRFLGSGSLGVVYQARDKRLDRPVAIKLPRAGSVAERDGYCFARDVMMAARLDHPNIVRPYAIEATTSGVPYIVSQYVDGQSLRDLLEAGTRFTPDEAGLLMEGVFGAFEYAHGKGIVHADPSTGNILVTAGREPMITDFGLARRLGGSERMALAGTLPYMAPGLLDGSIAAPTPATDLWGCAVIFYELLVGERPFEVREKDGKPFLDPEEPQPPHKRRWGVPKSYSSFCMEYLKR